MNFIKLDPLNTRVKCNSKYLCKTYCWLIFGFILWQDNLKKKTLGTKVMPSTNWIWNLLVNYELDLKDLLTFVHRLIRKYCNNRVVEIWHLLLRLLLFYTNSSRTLIVPNFPYLTKKNFTVSYSRLPNRTDRNLILIRKFFPPTLFFQQNRSMYFFT